MCDDSTDYEILSQIGKTRRKLDSLIKLVPDSIVFSVQKFLIQNKPHVLYVDEKYITFKAVKKAIQRQLNRYNIIWNNSNKLKKLNAWTGRSNKLKLKGYIFNLFSYQYNDNLFLGWPYL